MNNNEKSIVDLNIHVVPEGTNLDNVLTIVGSHVNNGRTFRAKSQYIFTTKQEVRNIDCGCITTEYLVELPEVLDSEGEVIYEAWTGWLSELFVAAPSRERLNAPEQDPAGSYSRKYVDSTKPPHLR